jgi:cephalosporin hydroxylase
VQKSIVLSRDWVTLLKAVSHFRKQAARLDRDDARLVIDFLFSFSYGPYRVAPYQVHGEVAELYRRLRALRPRAALEIGTAWGGTLFLATLACRPPALVISLDLPDGPYSVGGSSLWQGRFMRLAFARAAQKLVFIRGNSQDATNVQAVRRLVEPIAGLDYCFIDGDHTYAGVKKDWDIYSAWVKAGGLVALHDILPHPKYPDVCVWQLWDEIVA